MSRSRVDIQKIVEELAEKFIDEELSNMLSVSSKLNLEPGRFIEKNYPGGIYSFLTVNGDVSVSYIKDNLDRDIFRKLTNKHFDSFIRMVDSGVNRQFKGYLNERGVA